MKFADSQALNLLFDTVISFTELNQNPGYCSNTKHTKDDLFVSSTTALCVPHLISRSLSLFHLDLYV